MPFQFIDYEQIFLMPLIQKLELQHMQIFLTSGKRNHSKDLCTVGLLFSFLSISFSLDRTIALYLTLHACLHLKKRHFDGYFISSFTKATNLIKGNDGCYSRQHVSKAALLQFLCLSYQHTDSKVSSNYKICHVCKAV